MDTLARKACQKGFLGSKKNTTRTNLYRLIEAIQEEVPPGEDALVIAVVSHLLGTDKIRVPFSNKEGKILDVCI